MPEHVAETYVLISFILGVFAGWLTLALWRWLGKRIASLAVKFGFVRILSKPRRNKTMKGTYRNG